MTRLNASRRRSAGSSGTELMAARGLEEDLAEWPSIWASCLRRIRGWCRPPNWSAADWFEEVQALGLAAAYQARNDYDPTRGVPLSAFVRQRLLAAVLIRYRQEWTYALHCGCEIPAEGIESPPDDVSAPDQIHQTLQDFLARLTRRDRWLLHRLFWDGWTETRVAEKLRISQPAVSKRKRSILLDLRRAIGTLGQK